MVSPITSAQLFGYHPDTNNLIPLMSFGICVGCGLAVEEDQLKLPDGTDSARWPVIHQNRWCKDCYADPKQ